ncbi:DUF7845 domain-containing protein [Salinarchaeum laminariae]|uniref:DUF7845 domain-containing protein n=1 Tax=Salinarchaeum laminariae TaxID=869888 RepID=UPI0020BE7803|nr:winged helix-turn-helix transcriptional regulator [Salinarchaeum laminariae]
MSVDIPADDGPSDDVTGSAKTTFPEPRAHGASVCEIFADFDPALRDRPSGDRGTLYARALSYWREHVNDPDNEPYVAVEDFEAGWLPEGDFALVVKSSRWKAGSGRGDDYSAYYQQDVMLREWRESDDGERQLAKPSTALRIELMPQYRDMVYSSGDPLECPYGEGTRAVAWTTWADGPEEIEWRMYQALRSVYGRDALDLDDRVDDSRRIQKAEAHVRFDVEKKGAVVETVDQSEKLLAWGGSTEIETKRKRVKQGWLDAQTEVDRWHLLGFDRQPFATEAKVYQIQDWHKRPRSDPFAHPKLEASFAGSLDGEQLPHADDWSEVMEHLRGVVATHCHWAGVEAGDLVADDYFDGSGADPWVYDRPTGRRQMLKNRYEDLATDIYREALKESTTAVYDILRVIAEETGATYDTLEDRVGLHRSTIQHHVARLAEEGVVKRLGNPCLVVFVSQDVLERAREIVREIRPDDMAEDMADRAEQRREHREEQRETDDAEKDAEPSSDPAASQESDAIGFEYLASLSASIEEIAAEVRRGQLGDRDVRVRVDELPPPLRR